MKLLRHLLRPRWSELAIETYERQIALAEAQKTALQRLQLRWASDKETSTPHKRRIRLDIYLPAHLQCIHVEFGPVPELKELSK